jgi:lysophospholipase L1-like esterase
MGKWGSGFSPSTLFANGEKGAWHDPSDFSSLFQDTGGTSAVTAVGQTVKRINDKSGNGVNITNSTGWVLAQDALGGYYLTADGATVFSAAISGWSGTALGLAAAFNTLTTPAANEFLIGLGDTTNSANWGGLRLQNTVGMGEFICMGGVGNADAVSTSQGVPADPHVYIARSAGPTVYRDLTVNTGSGSITSLGMLNVFAIGALVRTTTGNYAGGRYYGSIAVTRSFTDAEVVAVNNWLRSKFGITGFLTAVGDSHTYNIDYGVTEAQFYPRRIAAALGDKKIALNFGVSGNTTGNMVGRLAAITAPGKPDVAVIYGGTNDNSGATTVQASPAPTTTAFTVASTFGARYSPGALITVNGVNAEVLSVATDRITVTAPLGFTPSTGQAVALRTTDNLVKVGQAIQALGCNRILIPGLHYYNFASGLGDTTTVPNVNAAPVRAAEQAAASALGAVYVDLYAYMRALIVAGTYTQGDDLAWHVAVSNAHLNATGEQILEDAMFAAMQAQGWA